MNVYNYQWANRKKFIDNSIYTSTSKYCRSHKNVGCGEEEGPYSVRRGRAAAISFSSGNTLPSSVCKFWRALQRWRIRCRRLNRIQHFQLRVILLEGERVEEGRSDIDTTGNTYSSWREGDWKRERGSVPVILLFPKCLQNKRYSAKHWLSIRWMICKDFLNEQTSCHRDIQLNGWDYFTSDIDIEMIGARKSSGRIKRGPNNSIWLHLLHTV